MNLLARLDQVLEGGTDRDHDDAVQAVEALGRDLLGFASVLREHADHPVLAEARRRLTGLPSALRLRLDQCPVRRAARRPSPGSGLVPQRT